MTEDEQIQATSDEILIEKLRTNVEIACKESLEQRLKAVDYLIDELKKSTSSMTSVPKPMKHLIPFMEQLKEAYETFSNQDYRLKMADLLSLLSIIDIEKTFDILIYRLACPIENIGCWGHEYVRCLTLVLVRAYENPTDFSNTEQLEPLINQISRYYMEHNDEPDACDLLLKVGKLEDIIQLIDEESHKRVCTYLLQCYNYLPDPINFDVLRIVEKIYTKLGKTAQSMVIALKLNDHELMHDIFINCQDPNIQKQLAFLLARQLIVFEDDMDEELVNIATNESLYTRFMSISEKLFKLKPKTPDDVLHLQAQLGNRQAGRGDKTLGLISKSFVAAFHNAAIKNDLYYTAPRGEECIMRNRTFGRAVAIATIGMLHMWDIEHGLNILDKWAHSEDPHCVMGALAGVGIVSATVRSEFDPAIAILSEFLDHQDSDIKVGAIFGFAMAYSGSARDDILELLGPCLAQEDPRIQSYAALAIGLIYVGTCNEGALSAVSEVIINSTDASLQAKYMPMLALGLGLIFLGQQSKCEAALELLKTPVSPDASKALSDFAQTTVSACAYAGTGNVLEIQKMLRICTGEDSMQHAAAVIGIAVISLGDSVGSQMAKRMFEHVLQYGKPFARLMVPIALALTSVSQPLPEMVDTLHRIGHDTDTRVAANASIALGLLAAGTQNSRAINALKQLAGFHKGNPSTLMLLQIAEGMAHLGQGLMTLSPTYGDSMLLHPVALGSLMTVAFSCIQTDLLIVKGDPLLLFFVAPAIGPRFLVTLDENLEILPIQVRVGSAIDVVGQAGRPRAITGFQTLDTPVILAAGQRAEFVDDTYEPLSPILEGFVIVKKRSEKKTEENK
ncbi:Proteasome/cyclosome repeat family protein [Tritrichomonas foetus]|uniref:Proteasome/cyclosome repeat family protein n=1 Tax=Tritrichomonas foetus TaxID=1144522 RepID=A0A1J4J6T2_9EUKA|nr:Proteasome/cyclosome repeat family protein [Tritrichomonas foetus]|eukprot:OHS94361.1 Proteasome/cyclosome repeat family protein [Tritrichomonas foetus]